MIKAFYYDDLVKTLSALITYGLDNYYSYTSIEEYIARSSFIKNLENNSFNIDKTLEFFIEDTYHIKGNNFETKSRKGDFFAESYLYLFFEFNKSFEYLFLYWPLEHFIQKFDIYHEMDYPNLKDDFLLETQKCSLFKKLCLKKNIKYVDISRLTGLNINLLKKYASNDSYLYNSNIQSLFKLSSIFNVNLNIFLPSLRVYLDDNIYRFDKKDYLYRSYLGLYFALFFDNEINNLTFKYNSNDDYFFSTKNDMKLKVLFTKFENIKDSILQTFDCNTYIVIFPDEYQYHDLKSYTSLIKEKDIISKEIMIVTQENVYLIKKSLSYEITNTINTSLIIRAKEMALLAKK